MARARGSRTTPQAPAPAWTFLTNHAHVLLCIAKEPSATMRDVAAQVGITERAVQRIVADLEAAGYLERSRMGRCNRYRVRERMPLRHALERHEEVSSLLALARGGQAGNGR
ncbi:MAG: winged helix-turn-helix domain-containing protein [Polyangiaceae bacterium]|nr:winged helix-turn-helix domain-containing protein [Polyangiaceae bacterium]